MLVCARWERDDWTGGKTDTFRYQRRDAYHDPKLAIVRLVLWTELMRIHAMKVGSGQGCS